MLKGYKYRIYPKPWQKALFEKHFGCARYIWNWGLEMKNRMYARTKKPISAFTLIKRLPKMKKRKSTVWLSDVNSQSLQQPLFNLDAAFTNFFRRVKEGSKEPGYPSFKSRKGRQSFQCPQHVKVDFENGRIFIPKAKWVKIVFSRRFEGAVKTVTISRNPSGRYFASVLVDDGKPLPEPKPIDPSKAVGIDLGLKSFVVLSTGESVEPPKFGRKEKRRMAILSRHVNKKVKGSKNRRKAAIRLARLHERIADKRRDFLHKLSSRLVGENQAVCVEDLNVQGMQRSHSMAFSIGDSGWSGFVRMLEYKCQWRGKHLLRIGRFDPSSKMCSRCGSVNRNLSRGDRRWKCPACGAEHDRDANAATNIRMMALQRKNLIGKVPAGCRELTLGEI